YSSNSCRRICYYALILKYNNLLKRKDFLIRDLPFFFIGRRGSRVKKLSAHAEGVVRTGARLNRIWKSLFKHKIAYVGRGEEFSRTRPPSFGGKELVCHAR